MTLSRRAFGVAVLVSGIAVSGTVGVPRSSLAVVEPPLDAPYDLVTSQVRQFTSASSRVIWHAQDCSDQTPTTTSETIARIAVQGSATRTLYAKRASGFCSALTEPIKSNLVADATQVYWNTSKGLYALSTSANESDKPTLVTTATASTSNVELVISSSYVYALMPSLTGSETKLRRVSRSSSAATLLLTVPGSSDGLQYSTSATRNSPKGAPASDGMRAGASSSGNSYLYWVQNGVLWRYSPDPPDNGADQLIQLEAPAPDAVTGYFAENGTNRVYYAVGRKLYFLDEANPALKTQVYDADNSGKTIYDIVATPNNVFFLMKDETQCSPQPCAEDMLIRIARAGGSEQLIAKSQPTSSAPFQRYANLRVAGSHLVWLSDDDILRLTSSTTPAAAQGPNMRITGMSITQGIQKPGTNPKVENGVLLIQGRRTYVRVFVKAESINVPGVTARLVVSNAGGVLGTVLPINDVGTQLTVRKAPSRANLNDSFLFELPMEWLPTNESDALYLRAVLNPFRAPSEDKYSDNELTSGGLTFRTSPALHVQFVSWGYTLGGTVYYPRLIRDILQTYSWLIRAYPIASKIVYDDNLTSAPGLHPNLWFQYDDSLGAKVARTDRSCRDNLCASAYTNAQMDAMRADNGVPDRRFLYGFISDAAGHFPRGQACCGTNVSTGPAGSGNWSWDFDGSYADWYAAHEIGHTLRRQHPSPSAESCGNSASDDSYPHDGAQIGPDNNTEGFDAGDPSLRIPRAVYPGTTWHDVMSYCRNQWISDYTYEAMHAYMLANPSRPAARALPAGDFLQISGRLYAASAVIEHLWRSASVEAASPPTPGGYALRLFDAADALLSEHPFAAEPPDDAPHLTFHQIIPFAAGTRMIRVVRTSDGAVLASHAVSARPPAVSNVSLTASSSPITGPATLSWNAADPDGDALVYAVRYSSDAGASWVGVASGITTTSTTIDTSLLGGGSGRFRVVASDGVNTGRADSPDYSLQLKPPLPFILSPANAARLQYGQPVHFNGAVLDWQSGGVPSQNLAWTSNLSGLLGVGEHVDGLDLPVGEHLVTLVATNTAGLSATASITLVVHDDLEPPGPTLTAGPASIHWQVARNATQPVTDTLSIGNAGSGAVSWSAATDAPWLTLSAITGTVGAETDGAELVLTANPSYAINGATVTGVLTLTMAATDDAPAQTIAVPVGLARGVDWANPAGYFTWEQVFIPAVVR